MIDTLTWLLLADGTSDRALLPVIAWTLRDLWKEGSFAEPVFVPRQHHPVEVKVAEILREYRPDILFVHRDAEGALPEERRKEIPCDEKTVPVIPIRMTEAWLLISEQALRLASGNPNGKAPLSMPPLKQLEQLSDPKRVLHDMLRQASGYQKRRLAKFKVSQAVQRIANLIDDYTALLQLNAYVDFREELVLRLNHFRTIAPEAE